MDERFQSLSKLIRYDFNSKKKIEDVLPHLSSYIINYPTTGDIYLDFSSYCATVLLENYSNIKENMISVISTTRRLIEIVISWGIYPHLPKSLHIPFLDDEHWLMTEAPPRMLRPRPEMLNALECLLLNDGCSLIHPLFLQHAICIFYYLEKNRVEQIIENQTTENVISCLIALFQTGLEFGPLLIEVIRKRTDSFEAIEHTTFPLPICARAISVQPVGENEDKYYEELFPRLFNAVNSKKGENLAKEIMSQIIRRKPEQFLKNWDLGLLLEWPSKASINQLIWQLDSFLFPEDCKKVLIPPIPQRLLFIAAQTTDDVHDRSVNLIKNILQDESTSSNFIKSIIEIETLSPLDLDHISIVTNENGVFAVEDEREDDFDILEKMYTCISELIDIKVFKNCIDDLPPLINAINFLSLMLMKFKEIDVELATLLLIFLSKFKNKNDVSNIVNVIISMSPDLKEIPQVVYDSFSEIIPEIKLFSIKGNEKTNKTQSDFDKVELLHELSSPIVPYRAHSLYVLRKGVMTPGHPLRDEETIKSIFPSIQKQLEHKDSFVFMHAIFALEAIADVFPHLVIETLASKYPQKDEATSLTISQVLMLCARRTGPGLIHSSDGNLCGFFIKAFARGVVHESTLIQASSLSDLATFVETLSFGCAPWFTDIVTTVTNTWQVHKPLEVRRAASYLAYKIVITMGDSFPEFSLGDLQNLINCVKRMRSGDFDEVSHQNAEDCYQTMWEICPMLL